MANIFGYVTSSSTNPGVWEVSGSMTLGSDGYTVTSTLPREILSLTRASAGNFTLFLQHNWYAVLDIDIKVMSSTLTTVQLVSHTIGVSGADGTQGVVFKTLNSSNTAADPAASAIILFSLTLKNTDA